MQVRYVSDNCLPTHSCIPLSFVFFGFIRGCVPLGSIRPLIINTYKRRGENGNLMINMGKKKVLKKKTAGDSTVGPTGMEFEVGYK